MYVGHDFDRLWPSEGHTNRLGACQLSPSTSRPGLPRAGLPDHDQLQNTRCLGQRWVPKAQRVSANSD